MGEGMTGATKTKRRGHNEGTIRQRSDGSWEARISLPGGARKSYYGRTRKAVQDKLRAAQRGVEDGRDVGAKAQTVAQFLDAWLADVVKPARAAKTHAGYADIVRLHLKPALGHHRLDRLTEAHVAALLKAKGDAGLSPRTRHHIRAVLRAALNVAVKRRLIVFNPAANVESPRQTAAEVRPLTAAEAGAILAAAEAQGDRMAAAYRVALTLGLREGEVLGLRWQDLDLERRTLRVRQAVQRIDGALIVKGLKTEKSRRRLTMPASLVAALRAQGDRQAFERRAAGAAYGDRDLVFATAKGTPIDPRNLIRSWHRLLGRAGMERRPFHTTRHTAASLLLAEGVPVKTVQEVLGHSMLSTTADTYGHLFPEAFQEAADAMERALEGTERARTG